MRRLNGVDALMLYLDGGSAYNHTLKISVLDPSTDPDGWSFPKVRRMFEEFCRDPDVLPSRYRQRAERMGVPQTVCDYLAGMTDRYAVDEYARLF